jgi:aspartyl/asparaginyl beta-hydroxylase (cupin superfamily)
MDKINPDYYKNKTIETIEVIRNELTSDEFRGYLKGQIFKYLARHRQKNGIEDLKKAQWYMNYLVQFENEMEEAIH